MFLTGCEEHDARPQGTAEEMIALGVRQASSQYTFDPPSLLVLDTIVPAVDGAELGRALGLETMTPARDEQTGRWLAVPPVSAFLVLQYIAEPADTLLIIMDYASRPPPHGPNLYAVGHEIRIRQRPGGAWELISVRKSWEH